MSETHKSLQVVLTISGLDPTGGAGMLADLRVIRQHDMHPVAAVTAVTAQHSQAVEWFQCVEPGSVERQIKAILAELSVTAVKVGMLGCPAIAEETLAVLRNWISAPVVLDPVTEASTGQSLFQGDPVSLVPMFEHCRLLTPNLKEAEAFTGRPVRTLEDMRTVAKALRQLGAQAVLVKGGHLEGPATDVLYDGVQLHEFVSARVSGGTVRGTGCALSSSIACRLARDEPLPEAVLGAKRFVSEKIETSRPVAGARRFMV